MPRRPRRWARRALAAVALLAVLALVALVVLVRSLDRPWLKRRLVAMARARTGLDVDWTATRVGLFSGLRVDSLVVRTPPALRGEAPELLRVDGLDVAWTAGSLLAGTPRLRALRVESLALTLVRDDDGRTSLSTIEPHGSGAPAPPVPPSRAAADALAGAPPVGRIDVARATVTLIARAPAGPRERLRIDGLALHATLLRDGGSFRVAAALGTPGAPLALAVTRTRDGVPAGEARARLWAELTASPGAASARLDVEVLSQTLSPATPISDAAHLEASARFADGHVAVAVNKTRLADGAATVEAEVDLPDAGPPRIERAAGAVDLPRLLALVPASLAPVEAERAQLRYRVQHLLLSASPRLDDDGSASIEGELGRVRLERAGGAVVADGGKLTVTARPEGGVTVIHVVAPLASLALPGFAAEGLRATADARVGRDGVLAGDATLRFGAIRVAGATRLAARDGELAVHAEELRVDADTPLATRGLLTVRARAAALDAEQAAVRADADGLAATVRARLTGAPPYAVDAELPIAHLRLTEARGRTLVDAPVRVALRASGVRPDAAQPRRTRAVVHADLSLGALTAALDADKAADAVDFKLRAEAGSLAVVRPLIPRDAAWSAPWDKMSLTVVSAGRVERFAAPSLREHTELALAHAAFRGRGGSLAADRLQLTTSSSGSLARHDVAVELRTRALRVAGAPQGDATVTAKLAYDGRAPSAHVTITTAGDKGPQLALDATLGFDRARRAVTYDLDAKVARLSTLGPLLHGAPAGFDFDTLAVALKGAGSFAGLVRDVRAPLEVRFVDDPLRTLAADGTLDLTVDGLDWSRGDREVQTPHARWHAVLATDGARRLVHGTLSAGALTIDFGDHELEMRDLRDDIDGSITGDLRVGLGELDHHLAIRRVTQDLADAYRVGDVTLDLKARRDADGVVHISQLALANALGGTTLALRGGLDAGAERRSLSLRGELTQDLSRVWAAPTQLQGKGRASVQLRLDSGNLRVYHALAAVRVSGATIKLPRAGFSIESMDGEIPLTADLVLDAGGLHLLRSTSINTYSELRFADQHPLLSRPSFVSVARVVTPLATLAPLAGNLRVDNNIVSLNQLELGLRGGHVTGQCILDWRPDDATVQLRVRASDVASSHGEPFDGNAAIVVSTRDRSIDGRAEILRIGKRHLLDLLELDDPHHADAAVNRVRRALALGYPDQVRLSFKHGFANVKITLGGLARLVRVDELRGIPMGPVIDKVLAPLEPVPEEER